MITEIAPEVYEVETKKIACDGGGGPLGHPKIYLEMGENSKITCPYCSRQFHFKNPDAQNSQNRGWKLFWKQQLHPQLNKIFLFNKKKERY